MGSLRKNAKPQGDASRLGRTLSQAVTWVFEDLLAEIKEEIGSYVGPEQRKHEREEMPPIPMVLQPLNEHLEPTGRAFSTVLKNISATGIGLSFAEHVEGDLIQIQCVLPSGKIFKTVIRVRHRTPNCAMIGGEFQPQPEIT